MTPLEQSKEIIRKHCEKQTKPCYLMRDLEDPFSEIETELKDYELLKERTRLDSFECLMRLEEILPRGKELLIPVAKELKDAEKNKEVLDLIIRKGVNVVLLDYLHQMNPDNAFEVYNKEMRKAWCDLYELKRHEFNTIVDYLKEQTHDTRRN